MKKALFLGLISLLALAALVFMQYHQYNDGLLHVVFCDVGQGDAILIRSPQGKVMLFDAGPNDAVASCLSDHMPFWQRTLSLVVLSHPHADHFRGLFSLLDRYSIAEFGSEELVNNITEYKAIDEMISNKHIRKRRLLRGDTYRLGDNLVVQVLGPTQEFLTNTSPLGNIGERDEFASLVLLVSYENFDLLLTGDSQNEQLSDDILSSNIKTIDVLQVPHHGSATGLTQEIVQELSPKLAVMSVGKNRYGHPSEKTMEILRDKDIKTLRTDKNGDVELVSDGEKWSIVNNYP
ncbi:MAG: MBL fold metallo-hydrolase [Candidatus Levybacteria bacterium]|nr:MBL fold metallo-hydrolase [Candidatus Levybacteria bacterium]